MSKRLVIVKHEGWDKAYLYELPPISYVHPGQMVLVKTGKGNETVAYCMCEQFTMDSESAEYARLLKMMGAKEPLSKVVAKLYEDRLDKYENTESNS